MKIQVAAAFGAVVLVCLLAVSCGPGLNDDMKVICAAGGSGQVIGVSTIEAKKAGLKQYLGTNVKSTEGKAFATELQTLEPAAQVTKLEAGIKAAGIDAEKCTTLTMLKQLAAQPAE